MNQLVTGTLHGFVECYCLVSLGLVCFLEHVVDKALDTYGGGVVAKVVEHYVGDTGEKVLALVGAKDTGDHGLLMVIGVGVSGAVLK